MFKLLLICVFLFTLIHCKFMVPKHVKPLSQEMIDIINSFNTTWKAGKNFEGLPLKYLKRFRNGLENTSPHVLPEKRHLEVPDFPESFDARDNWPYCRSISNIMDEGGCLAGWAVAAVGVMSDRTCIASKGKLQVSISLEDSVSCGAFYKNGCGVKFTKIAWLYWVNYGLVTGGSYNSSLGCKPYTIEPCDHRSNSTRPPCYSVYSPNCVNHCIKGYNKKYLEDKHYGKEVYSISKDENQIKAEIYKHGPVEAEFDVYSDFLLYKSGVYQRKSDQLLLRHFAKIIGWGVENKVPYWLATNSWNSDWGDRGYFKILRGNNECGFESGIIAGLPDI